MEAKKHPHFTHAVRGKKTTRIFHTLFDGKYGLFFALGGGRAERLWVILLGGDGKVLCFLPPVYFLPGLQFPDVGVVLADGAVG